MITVILLLISLLWVFMGRLAAQTLHAEYARMLVSFGLWDWIAGVIFGWAITTLWRNFRERKNDE